MTNTSSKFISYKETRERTSLSRTSIYHLVVKDRFPKPVRLGPGRKAFVASEVEAWCEARIAARDTEAA